MGDFEALSFAFGIIAAIFLVSLVYLIVLVVAWWKLFKKAGKKWMGGNYTFL